MGLGVFTTFSSAPLREGGLMRRLTLLALSAVVAALLITAVGGNSRLAHALTVVPQGFTQTTVTAPRTFEFPHDMAFAPDGRLFVAQQTGTVHKVNPDGTTSTFLDISDQVHYANSFGLLGFTFDPQFATNRFVYLFYTTKAKDTDGDGVVDVPMHNRIVRVTADASGDRAVPGSEQLLLRLEDLEDNGLHNGGSIKFGADGKLYATVGENNRKTPAQTLNNFFGKVVRINRDGTIPTDNPYYDTASGDYRAIWARGLRNPYKMAVQRGTGTIFINDVGGTKWEEINEGAAGANYGWPVREGVANDPQYADPVFAYPHDDAGTLDPNTTGCSIIGGAFYNPSTAQFPSEYVGDYFFTDFCNDWIRRYDPATDQATLFATEAFNPLDLEVSEDGSLYVMQRRGAVIKIQFTDNANRPPSSVIAADPTSGPLPLTVNFDGSRSSDPDAGDTLSYLWDFGDGSPTETTTTPKTSHTYSTKDTYTASLRVRDNHGALSDPDTVRIDASNAAPDPVIGSPSADLLFKVGQRITLSGSATDPEDGALPDSAFSWDVLLWHNGSHNHPIVFSEPGNNVTFTAPAPEDLFSATGPGNYLEVRFTATDSTGLSKTVTREVQPNRVNLTFGSNPSGLSLEVDDQAFVAPKTLVSWEGYRPLVNAPSPQTLSGTTYGFSSWSDAGAQQHEVLTGAAPSTYTATYTGASAACTITGTRAAETLTGTSGDDVICGGGGGDTIKGLSGNDTLKGESAADKLYGGDGDDTLDGGLGTDTANYSSSLAAITASLTDNKATGEGSDTLTGVEYLVGSPRADTLTGSAENNTLTGGGGNDKVVGGGGADTLYGGGAADTVDSQDGVNGNDSLDGGAGTDTKVTDATERSIVGFP
jgi:glucose/arabinose dehydrogenase/PKD repeat protein